MRIVTSYINPDLDGVASGVVYAVYLAPTNVQPMYAGQPSTEAAGVLDRLGLTEGIAWTSFAGDEWEDVALVDCHHPAQVPHLADLDAVSVVIDHHPDGDAAAFPNAAIQNEQVGAAATLVAEHVLTLPGHANLDPVHAALLAAAIASNTLDFHAPSTTSRDRAAYASLVNLAAPVVSMGDLLDAMRQWRQGFLALSTREAIERDCKLIETPLGLIAVSQLEGADARLVADRPELVDELARLVTAKQAVAGLVSLVDTASNTTTLVASNTEVYRLLMKLNATPVRDCVLLLQFIALRKTHIIPAITSEPHAE